MVQVAQHLHRLLPQLHVLRRHGLAQIAQGQRFVVALAPRSVGVDPGAGPTIDGDGDQRAQRLLAHRRIVVREQSEEHALRRRVTDPSRDNFEIYTVEDWIGFVKQFMNALGMVFGFVAAIALLVGGIGIMNIMLVTVTERTREIGLRMALGANRIAVLSQFLVEAVVLTLVGGAIGLLFGWGIGLGVGIWLAKLMKISFTAHVPMHIVLITLGISMALGVVFGVFPAFRASQMDPVRAMGYD